MNTTTFLYKSSSDSSSENEWGSISSDEESDDESIQNSTQDEHESEDELTIDYVDSIKDTIYRQHISSTDGQTDEFSALERSSLIIHELLQSCPTKDINTIKLMKLEDKEQIACLIHSYGMELVEGRELIRETAIVNRPKNGVHVVLRKRRSMRRSELRRELL